jgi:integrase
LTKGERQRVSSRRRRSSSFGTARRLPSGRWQAGYNHEGQRYWTTFDTKADADAWLARARTQISRAEWVDPSAGRMTVAELAEAWLRSNSRKRASTLSRDEAIMRRHVVPVLGPRRIAAVTPHDVQVLVNGWAEQVAASTVGRQYTATAAMFSFAVDAQLIARSPCRRIRLPQRQLVDRPELSAENLFRLAEALGPDQAMMMWTAAVSGLRFAECAGLTVDRLDLLGGTLTVDRQLSRTGELLPPKSAAGKRRLACPMWLLEEFAGMLARRHLTAADGDAFVFVSPGGGQLQYTNWRRRSWVPACRAAGMPDLVFHDLRSLSATALIRVGADVKTTQKRLGHSSPQVTLGLYARATAEGDREAADRVGSYLRPDTSRRLGPAASSASARVVHAADSGSDDELAIPSLTSENEGWALRDSNPRPQPCEGCALTN